MTYYNSPALTGWRHSAGSVWHDYVNHPFVLGLGDGSLPHQSFLNYLIQDYIFLMHFSRAWAMAIVKADTVEEMRTAAATVNALINEEIQLHTQICQREGISEEELFNASESPENLAYTRYVIDAGVSGDLLDLLAALAPCVFGYGEIGLNLAAGENTSPTYREWIDTYAHDDYQQVCVSVSALIENAVAKRLGSNPEMSPRWPSLCDRFTTATRLEIDFWGMSFNTS